MILKLLLQACQMQLIMYNGCQMEVATTKKRGFHRCLFLFYLLVVLLSGKCFSCILMPKYLPPLTIIFCQETPSVCPGWKESFPLFKPEPFSLYLSFGICHCNVDHRLGILDQEFLEGRNCVYLTFLPHNSIATDITCQFSRASITNEYKLSKLK